jgi:hypothetical protein
MWRRVDLETRLHRATCGSKCLTEADIHNNQLEDIPNNQLVDTHSNQPVDIHNNQLVDIHSNQPVDIHNSQLVDIPNNQLVDIHNSQLVDIHNNQLVDIHNNQRVDIHNSQLVDIHNSQLEVTHSNLLYKILQEPTFQQNQLLEVQDLPLYTHSSLLAGTRNHRPHQHLQTNSTQDKRRARLQLRCGGSVGLPAASSLLTSHAANLSTVGTRWQ